MTNAEIAWYAKGYFPAEYSEFELSIWYSVLLFLAAFTLKYK